MAYLASMALLPWDEFWIAGGSVPVNAEVSPGLFQISQIVAGAHSRLWINADSDDTGYRDEVFFMGVKYDERFGEREYEVRWRPRRARMKAFPPSLPLDEFGTSPRQYELVSMRRDVVGASDRYTVTLDSGLLVTNDAGARLLFFADQDTPLDMFVTMSASHIDDYLRRADSARRVARGQA